MIYIVGTFTQATATSIDDATDVIRTSGREAANDGGAATYQRTAATLDPSQEGYSWFHSADGAMWQLALDQPFYAAQFGALGGAEIDARSILNTALAAPMVQTLNLGSLSHYVSIPPSDVEAVIIVPSGKWLVGVTRSVSSIYIIPVPFGTRTTPVQTVYHLDDINGGSCNYSVYCQRSGLGGSLTDRVAGVTIRAKNQDAFGTIIERVDVYDATGYAHYDSADYGGDNGQRKMRGIERRRCRAFNSQVCFESTGDVEVLRVDCYSNTETTTWDGGALVPCEAIYHEYGPIFKVRTLRCVGYGQAGAGALPAAVDPFNLRTVIYEDCAIEVTNAVPALSVQGQVISGATYGVLDLQIVNSRFVSANSAGASLNYTTAQIRGGKFVGGANALNGQGDGAGIDVSTGTILDIYDADVTGNSNPTGQAAANGLFNQAGVVNVFGGRIQAVGPAGLMRPVAGAITVVAPALLTPVLASNGSALPLYRQRVRGEKAQPTWGSYNPVSGNLRYFVNVSLPTSVASQDLTDVVLTLRGPNGDLTFAQAPLSFNWQSNALIQVQIAAPIALPSNFALRYSIIEWLS
ncbi:MULTISPECIES: hypothetical protein [unclassified Sphingomonas]|uniref:hypothetical protein n=1 Tax=unclassified Sphingomonas TaxID=196159 RepID=UPI00226ACE63|nr:MULTISPECIES: hypothetical protein [unclassified Sphingomonas]